MDTKTLGIIGGVALIIALLSPLFLSRPKDVETHYEEANKLFETYKYEEAIKKYNKAIKVAKKPGARSYTIDKDFHALANYKIALCYEKLGEKNEINRIKYYTLALNHIQRTIAATNVYKHKMNLTFLQARILQKNKMPMEAGAKYTYFVQAYPNSPLVEEALYQIGIINSNPLNYDKVYVSLNQLIDLFPTTQYREDAEYRLKQLLADEVVIPDPPEPIPEFQRQIQAAIQLKNKKRYYDAYLLLKNIPDESTDRQLICNVYENIGDIFFEVENFLNAQNYYEKALQYADQERQIQLLNDKRKNTFIVPDGINKKDGPDSNLSHFTKAILLREDGRFLEAATKYASLSNSDISPKDKVYAIYWSGYCYYKAGTSDYSHYKKSIGFFERLINEYEASRIIEPTDMISAYLYLVKSYSFLPDNVVKSKERYHKIIELGTTVDRLYNIQTYGKDLVSINEIFDQKRRAEEKLRILVNPQPIPTPLKEEKLVQQGREHYDKGNLEKAVKYAKDALELNEEFKPAQSLLYDLNDKYLDRGESYLDQDRYDEAITQFNGCIGIDKTNKNAYFNIGLAYIYKEEFERSIQPLKNVIDIDNEHKKAYYNLAYIHYRLDLFNYALNYVNMALEIDFTYQNAQLLKELATEMLNN